LTVMNQNGQVLSTNGTNTNVKPPSADSSGGWELEESLDVEWAHSMAPSANILLVVANSANNSDLFGAVTTAAAQKGVVVVSMSWGMNEASGESSYDSTFVAPKSNPGVVFVASSGDSGGYYPLYPYDNAALYPSVSPYVFSVGGTSLNLTSTNNYSSETAWVGGGGGPAQYEGEPSYQYNQPSIGSNNVKYGNTLYSARSAPDVAYNADPNTGYAVYDSTASPSYGFKGGWTEVGGTSAGAPQWSALVALTDQYRFVNDGGKAPLDTYQVQTALYNTLGTSNYSKIFHDITSGSNGPWNAGTGYDWNTGLGTPIGNWLVHILAGTSVSPGLPSIKGSGYGAVTSGFGSSTYTTTYFASSSGGSQGGGGLYANSGSLSIAPVSPSANGLNGPVAGALLMPFAVSTTFSFSAMAAPTTGVSTNASNFVGNVPTLASGSPSTATASTTAAAANALAAQSNIMLGASGWKGTGSSSRVSSPSVTDGIIDQPADEMNGNLEDVGDFSADSAIDSSGGDWSILDATAPPLFDGEAADAGDAGNAGAAGE
jgi:subtilase family serine protease